MTVVPVCSFHSTLTDSPRESIDRGAVQPMTVSLVRLCGIAYAPSEMMFSLFPARLRARLRLGPVC